MVNLTAQQFRQAADIKEQIIRLEKQLDVLLGGKSVSSDGNTPGKRTMSAAARAKIAAAQRARWAKEKGKPTTPAPAKAAQSKKREMTPAAKAALSAKLKAAWAKRKSAKK